MVFPLPMWQSIEVRKGQRVAFGFARSGLRAYLAVQGGFDVPTVLGSAACVPRNQLGGLHQGKGLEKGDRLLVNPLSAEALKQKEGDGVHRQASARFIPDYNKPIQLRVIESYQQAELSRQRKAALLFRALYC